MRYLRENLLAQFCIASFLTIAAVAALSVIAVSREIKLQAINIAADEAVANSRGRLLAALTPADLEAPMTGAQYTRFNTLVQMTVASERVARIKVWSRDGTVIYSDEPELVGQRFPGNENLHKALRGERVWEIEEPEDPENVYERGLGTLLSVYVPIIFPDSPEPQGAFEIYRYYLPTAQHINSLRDRILVLAGLAFAVINGALFSIVWRGWRTINRQRAKLRQALEKEKQREQEIRALFTSSPIGIYVVQDGKFQFVNPKFQEITGYSADELLGSASIIAIVPEDRERVRQSAVRMLKGGHAEPYEYRITRKDGQSRWILETVTPVNFRGRRATLGNFMDITERKQAEEALTLSNRQLKEALVQLEETQLKLIQEERFRALGQMASGIAHEFNNALTPILGFSELLLGRPEKLADRQEAERYLRIINTSARDAAAVVSRLSDFYRRRDKGESFEPVNLHEIVEQAISITQAKWKEEAQAKGIPITVETRLSPVPPVSGNAGELREALTNLILNAVDALPAGGKITLGVHQKGQHVLLEVTDTGTGMSEEVRQHCLEPFFTTKGPQGTGIGLAMVHGIVRRHEGTTLIESEAGQGTRFIIHLPIRTQPPARKRDDGVEGRPTSPLHILVVDDEPLVRQTVAEYLTSEGHTVETAIDGQDGLERLRSGAFHLVLVDRAMPSMNGDQMAEAIKREKPGTPVILLTGFGGMMRAGERPAGVDLVLGKPVTLAKLQGAVAAVTANFLRRGIKGGLPQPGMDPDIQGGRVEAKSAAG